MADCHQYLSDFHDAIKLSASKRDYLRTSRDALRDRVRKNLPESAKSPKFYQQGSFATHTIITPLNEDYDVDDGVYFLLASDPVESPETYHRWIFDAVEGHTDAKPINKNVCIRVRFSAGYHVDLPIYVRVGRETPRLAVRPAEWRTSDPLEFRRWLEERLDADGQLRRIIRYLKAWKDSLSDRIPSGFVLSILAAENFKGNERDDVAFAETLEGIRAKLDGRFECLRPTAPKGEDLLLDTSDTVKQYFLDRLDSLVSDGHQAIQHPERRVACLKWKKHLGDRFKCPDAGELGDARRFEEAALIRSSARSAFS